MSTKVASILAEIGIDSSKFTSGANSIGGLVSSLINGIAGLNPVLGAAITGFTTLAAYMGDAEKEAAKAAEGNAKMEAILNATGYAAGMTATQLDDLANSLSQMSGIDDDVIKSSESMMLTFRNIGRNEFPQAMEAAVNLQTTFGSLESSTMQLGKALNDPIAGITALARAGVTFSDAQKAQIKGFVETNQLAQAQGIILKEVANQVGGTAAAIEKAGDGSNRLKIAQDNLSEAMGARLVPMQRAWNNLLADTYDAITKVTEAANTQAGAVDKVANAEGTLYSQQYLSTLSAEDYGQAMTNMVNEQMRADEMGKNWEATLRGQGVEFENGTSRIKAHADAVTADTQAAAENAKTYADVLSGAEKLNGMNSGLAQSLSNLSEQRAKEQEELDKAAAGYWAYDAAGSAIDSRLDSVTKKIDSFTVGISGSQSDLNKLIKEQDSLQSSLSGTDLVWGQNTKDVEEHKQKLAEIDAKIADTNKKYVEALNNMAYESSIKKIEMMDGVAGMSDAEFAMAQKLGVQMGVFSTNEAQMATNINMLSTMLADGKITVEQYGAAINALPSGKTIDVILNMIGAQFGKQQGNTPTDAASAQAWAQNNKPQARASGGPAAGMTLVGENGPEVVNLPGGSFVNNNNATRNMLSGGGQDNGALAAAIQALADKMENLRMDYGALSSAFTFELQRAGIGQ